MHGASRPRLALPALVTLAFALALVLLPTTTRAAAWYSPERKHHLRQLAEATWRHAYDSYKLHAFPADELLPLSCSGQGHDRVDRNNAAVNDVMGDYLLTVVDSLDTLAMLGDKPAFEQAVRAVIDHVDFDVDSRVQVFEVTIRMMGGLLSGHLLALPPSPPGAPQNGSTFTSSIRGFDLPWYRSELLALAHDLGRRLLPAFDTPTGIPFARVHLQTGVRTTGTKGSGKVLETGETCAAGAGSLLLEFITLSRLTSDPTFELVARRAFFAVWNRRSDIGLVGNTIDARTGVWLHAVGGTGAGIDSFYEYAAKAYVLTGEDEYLRVWDEGHAALQRYVRSSDGFWYRPAHMHTGQLASSYVDSLSAFLPGVQVLMGDLDSATRAHAPFAFMWERYRGLPELFDTLRRHGGGLQLGYPLRPEFIESNMYLYQATGDDWYLSIAERALYDLNARARVECGFAAVKDLRTGELEDKMPSFVTGETLKYLYLTFAEDSPFLRDDSAFVFTTEGHPLEIPHDPPTASQRSRSRGKRPLPPPSSSSSSSRSSYPSPPTSPNANADANADAPAPASAPTCAAYDPLADERHAHFLALGMDRRTDWEHARWLAGQVPSAEEEERLVREGTWRAEGWCEVPQGEDSSIELLFAPTSAGEVVAPSAAQLGPHESGSGDVVVHSIAGLRFSLARTGEGTSAPGAAGGGGAGSAGQAQAQAQAQAQGWYAVTRVGGVPVPAGKSVVIRDEAVLASLTLPRKRVERVTLEAVVAPWDEPPVLVGEENEDEASGAGQEGRGGRTRRKLDQFIEMVLGGQGDAVNGAGEDAALDATDDPDLHLDLDPSLPAALHLDALAASFGPSLADPNLDFALEGHPLPLILPTSTASPFGCASVPLPRSDPAASTDDTPPRPILLLRRGECSFAQKAHQAARSGAAGVVLVSGPGDAEPAVDAADDDAEPADEGFIVPSAAPEDEPEGTMRDLVPLVLVGRSAGLELEALVRRVHEANARLEDGVSAALEDEVDEGERLAEVWVTVERGEGEEEEMVDEEVGGIYTLGGFAVTNCRVQHGGRRT
ncbi:hypothetical protein JCM8208_004442 [Rhodotorula glutinis]